MLAPTSMMTMGPWCDGKMAAMPGRRTPGRNILARSPANRAEATIAPVFPAETIAWTSPVAIRPQLLEMELSRFLRRASTGFSSMPIDSAAWTIGSRSRGASGAFCNSASIRSRSPTSTVTRSSRSCTASTAPATIGPGAKSPPIASRAIRIVDLPSSPSALRPRGRRNEGGMHDPARSPGPHPVIDVPKVATDRPRTPRRASDRIITHQHSRIKAHPSYGEPPATVKPRAARGSRPAARSNP